eukprot:1094949-Rhodomonas_salina.2
MRESTLCDEREHVMEREGGSQLAHLRSLRRARLFCSTIRPAQYWQRYPHTRTYAYRIIIRADQYWHSCPHTRIIIRAA